jgi:acyl-CoA thioester hydrolase
MIEQPAVYLNERGRLCQCTRFRVRYHETDRMGVVHHAAYVTWFEEGRSAFTRALGYSYAQMEADGIGLFVSELEARYHAPARYDEEVAVITCLDVLRSRGLVFTYEIKRNAEGLLLVTGMTGLISIDASGRVCTLPPAIRLQTEALLKSLSTPAHH